jgi:hypothetical protein
MATGKKAASDAGRILWSSKSTKKEKEVAASRFGAAPWCDQRPAKKVSKGPHRESAG